MNPKTTPEKLNLLGKDQYSPTSRTVSSRQPAVL